MKTNIKTQKTLLIKKLSVFFLLFALAAQPAISAGTSMESSAISIKLSNGITQGQIIEYLMSRGYTNINNVNPMQNSTNWLANARNPQGFNVTVIVFTDGWNINGHQEIWIK